MKLIISSTFFTVFCLTLLCSGFENNEGVCSNNFPYILQLPKRDICYKDESERTSEEYNKKIGWITVHLGKSERREATVFFERQSPELVRLFYDGNLSDDDVRLDFQLGSDRKGKLYVVNGKSVINEQEKYFTLNLTQNEGVICYDASCFVAGFETRESPLQFEIPSESSVQQNLETRAKQKIAKFFANGENFHGSAEWRDICKDFGEEGVACTGHLNAELQDVPWTFWREQLNSGNSSKIKFTLERAGTAIANGQMKIKQSGNADNKTTAVLEAEILGDLNVKVDVKSSEKGLKVRFLADSKRFDIKLDSSTIYRNRNSQIHLSHLTEVRNSTEQIAKYLLGFSKNGEEIDIRHNLTSDFYSFESNMTVSQTGNLTVTEITQRAFSPLWDFLNFSLRQVFFSEKDANWETVVMKSTLTDMHVTGKWIKSVLNFYDKIFQFKSNDETRFPSMNIKINYSNYSSFVNVFHFPFLAKKFTVSVNLDKKIFPLSLSLRKHDEFEPFEEDLVDAEIIAENGNFQVTCDINLEELADFVTPLLDLSTQVSGLLNGLQSKMKILSKIPELQLFKDLFVFV